MKVTKRSVPNDALSFTHEDVSVSVHTNRNAITVSVRRKQGYWHLCRINVEDFIHELLELTNKYADEGPIKRARLADTQPPART